MDEHPNVTTARRFLQALEQRADPATLASFLHPDVQQQELPNRLMPSGAQRGLQGLLEGAERGNQLLREQRFEVRNALASGDHVAMEVVWTGVLAIDLGTLTAGSTMRAYIGVFMEFRDGKIISQRNYDCYEPW
jgi:ketosteroid isomerase-like protein